MNCPRCSADNPDQARYCSQCGAQLSGKPARICPLCAMALAPETRFCISCGAAVDGGDGDTAASRFLHRHMPKQYVDQLLAAGGRVSGERRVITILFFDVKGSTAMAEKLDPEEVMEIMNGAFEVLSQPVYRYEGTLARLMGDALLCFFGAPITHEDDPARACRCALDILVAAKSYAKRLEMERGILDFNVRVGINTGLVVVGEVGADLRVEYTAMGDAVNLAARMESAAEPGTILITEHTYRLIHTAFETESLGVMEVKGRSEPVRVYRVLRTRSDAGTARGIEGLHSALIGREAEVQRIGTALADLIRGSGSAVAVIGEAGLGKSRLVREARRGAPQQIEWVEGRCLPYTAGMSYWLAKDLLHQLIDVDNEAPPAEIGEAIRRNLGGESGGEGNAYLAHLLGAPVDEVMGERIRKLEPEDLQQRIWQAYRGALAVRARKRPLALVLEDLHWVDPSSFKLLESLLPLTRDLPLMIILIFRREDGPLWELHRRLEEGDQPYQVLQLAPLSRDESAQLLQNLLRIEGMPAGLQTRILDRAEGNAFYLEEVLRSLLEEGVIALRGTEAVFSERTAAVEVPETLTGVIMARIDRLPPTEKQILQTASVLGRTFSRSVMARLTRSETGRKELDIALGELRRREFLLLPGDEPSTAPPSGGSAPTTMEIRRRDLAAVLPGDDQEYVFKHAMTVEVAYNSLLLTQRRDLHRRVGETLVSLHPERWEEFAPTLAYHFEKAEILDRAYRFLVMTAEGAADIGANQEAIETYLRALELVEMAGDPEQQNAIAGAAELAALREGLGDAYRRMSQYAPAMLQYGKALQIIEDSPWRATLHRKRGQVCEKWGRYDLAREYFEAGLRELQGGADQHEAANIYLGLGLVYYHKGQLEQAVQISTMALAAMEKMGDRRGVARALNNLGIAHGQREEWETAIDCHQRGLEILDDLDDSYDLATAHNNIGLALLRSGSTDEAIRHFQHSLDLFERLGNQHGLARACDNLSQAHLEKGEDEESRKYLERAVTLLAEISVDGTEIRPEMWRSGAW